MSWQPIETAPKDGRYIIAGRFRRGDELVWVKHSRWITASEAADSFDGEEEDYVAGWVDGENEDDACIPTHWQPLIAPTPTEQDEGIEG